MSLVLLDRVRETTTTAGTGPVTLLGAVPGYSSFNSIGNGNTTYYCIATQLPGTDWEVGVGSWSSNVLTRLSVLSNSKNTLSLINFDGTIKDVFLVAPSSKSLILNDNNELVANIVPRIGTLNSLLSLTGSEGELASATDAGVIIKYKGGSTTGGDLFTTNGGSFGAFTVSTSEISADIDWTLYPKTMDFLSFNTGSAFLPSGLTTSNNMPMIGFYNDTNGNAIISFDSINYARVAPPSGIICRYAITNNMLIAVPVASTSLVYVSEMSNNLSSWTSITIPTGIYKAPIVIGCLSVALTLTTSSTSIVVVDIFNLIAQTVTLPVSGIWTIIAPQFDIVSYSYFIVTRTGSTTQNAYQLFSADFLSPVTVYDISTPTSITNNTKISFTRQNVVILNAKQIYYAPYVSNFDGTPIRIVWTPGKTLLTNDDLVYITSNENVFFMMDIRAFYYSLDGVSWLKVDTKNFITTAYGITSSPKILAMSSGCLVYIEQDYAPILCFSTIDTYSINASRAFANKYLTSDIFKACGNSITVRPQDGVTNDYRSCAISIGNFSQTMPITNFNTVSTPINLKRGTTALVDVYATARIATIYLPPLPVHGQMVKITTKAGFSASTTIQCFVSQFAPYGTINGLASFALTISAPLSRTFIYDLPTNNWSVGY